jgi:2-amino-4-hydroxy-6-hydroxymethyldihydropteridine diphosphokinase
MAKVYLALGSNVGDPVRHIKQAVEQLRPLLADLEQAPLYCSRAVGYTGQPDFINTVVSGTTKLAPVALLARLKQIEQRVGRTATFRHGPREIDIDIIFYDNLRLDAADLVIPHPEFARRDFVLQPLIDLNPDLTDPASDRTVTDLLAMLSPEHRSLRGRVDANP